MLPDGAIPGSAVLKDVAVTPDGARVVSSSFDHDVRIWRNGRLERLLTGHRRQVGALAALGTRRAISGSREGLCRVWDLDSGASHVVRPHTLPLAKETW